MVYKRLKMMCTLGLIVVGINAVSVHGEIPKEFLEGYTNRVEVRSYVDNTVIESIYEKGSGKYNFSILIEPSKNKHMDINRIYNRVGQDVGSLYVTNKREYDYFESQLDTGKYSDINCVFAVCSTVTNWIDRYNNIDVKSLRNKYQPEGGLVPTNVVYRYLDSVGIKYKTTDITYDNDGSSLIRELNKGNIIIACIDVERISKDVRFEFSASNAKYGKHCVIITGYYHDKDISCFEVLDPVNDEVYYDYLKVDDILNGMLNHVPTAIIVENELIDIE